MLLYTVIPCYNEEEVLPETASRLSLKYDQLIAAGQIAAESRIVFVNDGSRDLTWEKIVALHAESPRFSGINLSRNQGHQNALLAGLMTVRELADAVISLDADLQDDIGAIDDMLSLYKGGCDIVYGVRSSRETDSPFKRVSAEAFYHLMELLGAGTVFNHADYRLMSRRALAALAEYREVNLFLRGLVPMIGFPSGIVYYERQERFAGKSKYPLSRMLAFAIDGITSLSTRPIRLITGLGFGIFFFSMLMLLYSVLRYFEGKTVTGWPSLIVSVWAIGGLILLSIGVVGEYVGKIYLETKNRPRYLVERFLHEEPDRDTTH